METSMRVQILENLFAFHFVLHTNEYLEKKKLDKDVLIFIYKLHISTLKI